MVIGLSCPLSLAGELANLVVTRIRPRKYRLTRAALVVFAGR